jgi:hypothetical protein
MQNKWTGLTGFTRLLLILLHCLVNPVNPVKLPLTLAVTLALPSSGGFF